MPRQDRWSAEKCQAFAKAWNSGVSSENLRERYGLTSRQFWSKVQTVRRRGFHLEFRTRERGWGLPR